MAVSSTTRQNFEQLSFRGPELSQHCAQAREIVAVTAATTLDIKQSGALVVFDNAAGAVVTLPAPQLGATYEFVVATTITSNAAKIITDSASTFLLGAVSLVNDGATTAESFLANGSTIRALSSNGTTTGGVAGDRYRITAINTTQWFIEGVLINSGTAATPFATS